MPYTLLLADDSVTIQRVIELTFADEDVKVIAVSDGDQAIERLEASPPDIVLADIGMPGKNGYEVAKYIKQSPKLSHIPVMLLTGAFEPVDQARAAEAGCDGVLAKPFEPQLVIARVKELLAKSRPIPDSIDQHLAPPTSLPADRWTGAAVDEAFAPHPAVTEPGAPLDDYFDRLDAAFQTLSGPTAVVAAAKPAVAAAEPAPDIDWFVDKPDASAPAEPWDLPNPDAPGDATDLHLSYTSPRPAFEAGTVDLEPAVPAGRAPADEAPNPEWAAEFPATAGAAHAPHRVRHADRPPERPKITALPSLADAFAALLAAEQDEPMPSAVPAWPATAASDNDLVEQITRRVLDRLSDKVVHDTVSERVSQIAERLIIEEIERIKASIK